ncbi:hypothetical protein GCM10009119_21460 [Algoriphagus jejuensis]|uniref:Uncharacterized protein n=1 Tax=Algoriphagus jejuensis TaxID=419934 RepID=A0ABN1N030_9BACT
MADSMLDVPYYYMTGHSLKDKNWDWADVPELEVGKWIASDDWKGATLFSAGLNQ